jgi:hypothetical protein
MAAGFPPSACTVPGINRHVGHAGTKWFRRCVGKCGAYERQPFRGSLAVPDSGWRSTRLGASAGRLSPKFGPVLFQAALPNTGER